MNFTAFSEAFARQGGKFAFGVPGGGPSLALVDALSKQGAQFITTGHETTAALMAGAVARQTGAPSLAVTIKGPGFANLAPGLLANAYEGLPMLSISEAYDTVKPGPRRHKWLDHARLAGEFLKSCRAFSSSPGFFESCLTEARTEFPGPVQVNLVESGALPNAPLPSTPADDPKEIFSALRAAQRPALVVGSLGVRAAWRGQFGALRVPVFTTPAAKGVLAEDGPFAAGIYTGDGKPATPEKQLVPQADLVLMLGVRPGEILNPAAPHARTLWVETAEVRDRAVFPPLQPGPTRSFLSPATIAEVLAELAKHEWGADLVAKAHAELQRALDRWPWATARLLQVAQTVLPDATHVLDTGNFTLVGEHCLRARHERQILGTPNGRYLGLGIGYALGAAAVAVAGRQPVVLWIGDGGLRAFFSELSLAAEQRWPLLVLVMRDGWFGSVRGRAESQGWTHAPLVMAERNFPAVAERMGLASGRVTNEGEFTRWLEAWSRQPGPALLECVLDADAYNQQAELLR